MAVKVSFGDDSETFAGFVALIVGASELIVISECLFSCKSEGLVSDFLLVVSDFSFKVEDTKVD